MQDLLIPVRKWTPAGSTLKLADGCTLTSPRRADALPLQQLADALKQAGVSRVRQHQSVRDDAAIRFHRNPKITHAQGYRLTISASGVLLEASTDVGTFHGVQTLRELLAVHGRKLPTGRIDDHPDLERRGIYLDTARGKIPTLDTLKALVDHLARWKYNELQLYVENGFAFAFDPDIGRGFDPFTPAELHELEAYAAARHVKLIGSLASFGHMELMLRLPQYRGLAELPGHYNYDGGTTISPVDSGSIKLVEQMYDEFVPLFDAVDFNACGDEPWELGKGRSKAKCEKVGQGHVYVDFMTKVDKLVRKHGKRSNVWADIVLEHPDLLGDWPKDIVMLNWGYTPDFVRIKQSKLIADAGLPWVACPGTNGWGSHGSRIDWAFTNVEQFTAAARKHGAEGMLHTDWGDGGHRNPLAVSLCSFAHAGAHAWHGRGVDGDAKAFVRRFVSHTFTTDKKQTSALADAILTLGHVCRDAGHRNAFYYSIRRAIEGKAPASKKFLRVGHGLQGKTPNLTAQDFDPKKLRKTREGLEPLLDKSAWAGIASGSDRWMADEFRSAALQDHAALQRCELAHRHHAGETVDRQEWKSLASNLTTTRKHFEKTWLSANRPSRVHENLALYDAAIEEAKKL